MKFFRDMKELEKIHWKKGAIFGFYVLLLLLLIDHLYLLIFGMNLISSFIIFWIGLAAAWVYSLILDRRQSKKKETDIK
ncbi:MAG: hypothetical protein ACQEUT_02715 [Bacillota bacterium]